MVTQARLDILERYPGLGHRVVTPFVTALLVGMIYTLAPSSPSAEQVVRNVVRAGNGPLVPVVNATVGSPNSLYVFGITFIGIATLWTVYIWATRMRRLLVLDCVACAAWWAYGVYVTLAV